MAQRAYAEASTSPEEYAARVLGRLLREERLPLITKTQILDRKLKGLRTVAAIGSALQLLVDSNILIENKVTTRGRPRIEYVVNSAIWK